MSRAAPALRIEPLDASRWADFEALFGANGACAGCWCMYWKLPSKQHKAQSAGGGAANKAAMRARVDAGEVPGLLAYAGDEAVGWVAVEPRCAYPRLAGSRILSPVDARPVWSVSCFFVRRDWRGRGLTQRLLQAAVDFASRQGADCVEGYPVDRDTRTGDAFVYTGLASTFRKAGFEEAARRSPTRPIMRKSGRTRTPAAGAGARRSFR